jgi:hypothetical protein
MRTLGIVALCALLLIGGGVAWYKIALKMMKMIAYSAIDEGVKPYGDKGIRALYDDAADIGRILNPASNSAQYLNNDKVLKAIADIVVEYAGLLAKNQEIESSNSSAKTGFEKGALYYDDVSRLIGDFSRPLWFTGGVQANIIGKKALADAVSQFGGTTQPSIDVAVSQIWGNNTSNIVKLVAATKDQPETLNAFTDAQIGQGANPNAADGAMLVGAGANDVITGAKANDLLIGGAGNDTLIGGRGDDLMFGGANDDTFTGYGNGVGAPSQDSSSNGYEGKDWLDGGAGIDTADYSKTPNSVTVTLSATIQPSAPNTFTVNNDGTGSQDTLLSIEKVKLSDNNDTVILTGDRAKIPGGPKEIDGGSESGGDGDVIDVSAYGRLFRLDNGKVRGVDLEFKNFETIDGAAGGVVIDVATNEIICRGLSMPHSPRIHRGQLWVLNSGTGEIGTIDVKAGQFTSVAFCPGYLRGLSFIGDDALVGLSEPRDNKTFAGLPLQDRLATAKVEPRCAVYVVDTKTGDISHWLRIEGVVNELYDVVALPKIKRPTMIGFRAQDIRRTVSIET